MSRHALSLNLSFSLGHIPTIDYLDLTAVHALPGGTRPGAKLGHNCKGPLPPSYSHLNDYAGHRKEAIRCTARLFIAEEGTEIPPRPSYASPEPRCGHFPANYPVPHCSAL